MAGKLPDHYGFYWAEIAGRPGWTVVNVFSWQGELVADLYPWIRAKTDALSEIKDLATTPLDDPRIEWGPMVPGPKICGFLDELVGPGPLGYEDRLFYFGDALRSLCEQDA